MYTTIFDEKSFFKVFAEIESWIRNPTIERRSFRPKVFFVLKNFTSLNKVGFFLYWDDDETWWVVQRVVEKSFLVINPLKIWWQKLWKNFYNTTGMVYTLVDLTILTDHYDNMF